MEIPRFLGPILATSLAVTGCSKTPDFGANIDLQCQTHPQDQVTQMVGLKSDQSFLLGGRTITIVAPGRVKVGTSSTNYLEIEDGTLFINGDAQYNGRTYRVTTERLQNDITGVVMFHNCSDPKNP